MTTGFTHWSTFGGLWGVQKRCIRVFQNQEYPYSAVSGVNHDIQSFFLKNHSSSLSKSLLLAKMGLEFVSYKPCKTDWLVHKWCYFSSCKAPFWARWRWRSTASTMDVTLKTTDFYTYGQFILIHESSIDLGNWTMRRGKGCSNWQSFTWGCSNWSSTASLKDKRFLLISCLD